MSRAVVQGEIDRLDALSRVRPLDDRESWRLQKMLTTLRRYDDAKARKAAA